MVQMCSAWHIEWQMRINRHNGLQASQTMLGLTVIHQIDFGCFSNLQRRRPGTPCNHSHRPWWNSISKRSLKDYWKSIWFCNFSRCGGGLLSFSEPCSVPKDLFISHSDQINRNHPESTGSAKRQHRQHSQMTGRPALCKWGSSQFRLPGLASHGDLWQRGASQATIPAWSICLQSAYPQLLPNTKHVF